MGRQFQAWKYDDPRQSATEIYLALMLLVFPLFTGFSGYTAITASKFFFFAAATGLWLAALLILTLRSRQFSSPGRAQIAALCFALICCISAVCSPFFPQTLAGAGRYDGLISYLLYLSVFWGVSRYGHFRPFHALCFAVSVTLCCTVALLQLLGHNPLHLFPGNYCYYDAHIRFTSEFLGTIGNVNLLSAILTLAIPLFFGMAVLDEHKYAPFWLLPLFFAILILSASGVAGGILATAFCAALLPVLLLDSLPRLCRGALAYAVSFLAAALAAAFSSEYTNDVLSWQVKPTRTAAFFLLAALMSAVLALVIGHCHRTPPPGALRKAFLLLLLLALLTSLLCLWFCPSQQGTLYELSQALHGHLEDSYGSSRILIWRRVFDLFPERPFLGGGPGTLPLRLDIRFSRYVEATGQTLTSYADNAHNEYLQVLADTGLSGLLCDLALLALVLFSAPGSFIQRPLLPALFAYCVQAFFGLGLCLSAPLFWIILGLYASRLT